jgi:two-component sensor histidine kinase
VVKAEVLRQAKDGTPLNVIVTAAAMRDDQGRLTGIFGTYGDITARKELEARQRLVSRELFHRVKNLLAVLQSVAARTMTRDRTMEKARTALIDRLQALGRAHWHSAGQVSHPQGLRPDVDYVGAAGRS